MRKTRNLLLSGAVAVAVASPAIADRGYFRFVRPDAAPASTPAASGPPASGTNDGPPQAGTNDGPASTDPVLTLAGVGAYTTQSPGSDVQGKFTLANGVGAIGYAVVSGAMPPELALAADGTLSGTTRTLGRYFFVVRGTDANQATSDLSVNMFVAPEAPQITVHMPSAPIFVGAHFTAPVSVDNGADVVSFSFVDMPPEFLALSGNELRGDPSDIHVGTWTYSIQALDAYDQSGTASGSFEILVPTLSIDGLPSRVRSASRFSAAVTTNVPDGTWAVTSDPAGVSGSVDGTTLSGTVPPVTSEIPYGLSVSRTRVDGSNATGTASLVAVPPLAVAGGGPVLARVGRALASAPVPVASNLLDPSRPATWALGSGTLPSGLRIDGAVGSVTGTPSDGTQGDYPGVAAIASDPVDNATAAGPAFAVRVVGALAFQGIPQTVTLTRGQRYSASPSFLNNVGGGSVTASNLPPNLAMDAGGATPTLSGTPAGDGTSVSRFAVTDPADGAQGAYDVTFQVVEPITAYSSSATARRTSTVSYTPALSGQAPYSTRLVSGSLPDNLVADPGTLRVTGSPTTVGSFTANYEVTDATGAVGNVPVSFDITPAPTAADGPGIVFRQDKSRYLASGIVPSGVSSPSWSMSGTWPAWLTLDAGTGFVEAIPGADAVGTSGVVVARVTDGGDQAYATGAMPYSVVAPLASSYPGTALVRENAQVPATIAAPQVTNVIGPGAATWSKLAGALPAGLDVNAADGRFTGTPAPGTAGGYQVRLAAMDPADGAYGNTPFFTLKVLGAMVFQGVGDKVNLTRGYSYAASPGFTNNTGGGTLTATGLPDGIGLQQTGGAGTLSGSPQTAGTYAATFSVVDPADGTPASHTVSYVVSEAIQAARPSVTMRRTQTKPYDPGLTGQGPYSWTLTSGSIPPGLQADPATLVMTGSPTTTGNYTATYALTDATGAKGSVTLGFTVNPAPTVTASKAFPIRVNTTRTAPNEFVLAGVAQPQWSLDAPSDWISIDPSTGVITGTPTYTAPAPGKAAMYRYYDPETTGSTSTQVTPGTIYYFNVRAIDLVDGAVATVRYMVKAYGTIGAVQQANCQTFLIDSASGFRNTGGGNCKNAYTNVMSTDPVNDFSNTVVPVLDVVSTSGSALPSQVTYNAYGQLNVPAGVNFEWAGYYRVTDPVDGQQARANSGTTDSSGNLVYSSLTISSEPTFTTPTTYSNAAAGVQYYLWNGETLDYRLSGGTVTGGTAPYRYTLYSDATNPATVLSQPPYGSFDTGTGNWSGTVSLPAGSIPPNLTGHMTVSDAVGRTKNYSFNYTGIERTATYACVTFNGGSNARIVYQDPYGIRASSFKVKYNTVNNAGPGTPTGSGTFKLSAYPGVDAGGVPTGTPTTVATWSYSSDYTTTNTQTGSSSTNTTSKVWVMEAVAGTKAAPAFTASMGYQNSFACSPP